MWQIAPAGIASVSVCSISRRVPTPLLYDSRKPLANGAVFAGYTIVRLLGSGGMGEVYLVKRPRLPRRDALKILPESMTADSEFRERFDREADPLCGRHDEALHDRRPGTMRDA
jgi:serine/threonine protein kinase